MTVPTPTPRTPWLTPRRGRLLFGIFLCLFGVFGLAGSINQYSVAQRRTAHVVAEVVNVNQAPPNIINRLFGTFKVTYRFSAENETVTGSGSYEVAPPAETTPVEYEPTRPKNNALLLPSREHGVVTLITSALILGGGWMIWRNVEIPENDKARFQ
jgi:hypothetical protein